MSDYETLKLLEGLDSTSSLNSIVNTVPVYTNFQSMFWVFAELLIVALLGFRCLEKGNKISRILAMVGLGAGVLGALLQIAAIWKLFPVFESTGFFSFNVTVMGKITILASVTMAMAIAAALIVRITESRRMITVLKYVAAFCGAVVWLVAVILLFVDLSNISEIMVRVLNVTSVVIACLAVSVGVMILLAWFNRRDEINKLLTAKVISGSDTGSAIKNESKNDITDVIARQRIESERKKAEMAAMPPLQDENMGPEIVRENEVKLNVSSSYNSGAPIQNQQSGNIHSGEVQ